MRRVAGGFSIQSLFLFFLTLPLLHLHPGLDSATSAVVHCHVPHNPGAHHAESGSVPILDSVDDDGLNPLPFEIFAVYDAAAQVASPDFAAILPIRSQVELDAPYVFIPEPESRAQPPPGHLINLSFRSPPA